MSCHSCNMGLSKFLHEFFKIAIYISHPFPNKAKLVFNLHSLIGFMNSTKLKDLFHWVPCAFTGEIHVNDEKFGYKLRMKDVLLITNCQLLY